MHLGAVQGCPLLHVHREDLELLSQIIQNLISKLGFIGTRDNWHSFLSVFSHHLNLFVSTEYPQGYVWL